jgi:hypothetical protein
MKKVLVLVGVLVLVVAVCNAMAAPDTLLLRVYSDSSIYLAGDYMPVDIYLVNNTDRPLSVVPLKPHDTIKLRCYDSAGKIVAPYSTLWMDYAFEPRTVPLAPHDSLRSGFELRSRLGAPVGKNQLIWQHPLGDFTVEAVFAGKLVSNPLRYSVIKPTGVEGEIYDRLVSISDRYGYGNLVDAVGELTELLASYPHSVYAPQFLYLMHTAYLPPRHPDDAKVIAYGKKLVSDYPYFDGCFEALEHMRSRLSSQESISYLQQVIASRANTRAERFARFFLGERESGSSGKAEDKGVKQK